MKYIVRYMWQCRLHIPYFYLEKYKEEIKMAIYIWKEEDLELVKELPRQVKEVINDNIIILEKHYGKERTEDDVVEELSLDTQIVPLYGNSTTGIHVRILEFESIIRAKSLEHS